MQMTQSKFWSGTGSQTVKPAFGKLLSLFGFNAGADVYLQCHSKAVPDGTSLLATQLAQAGNFALDIPVVGMGFDALYIHQSSTPFTYTVVANSIGYTTVLLA